MMTHSLVGWDGALDAAARSFLLAALVALIVTAFRIRSSPLRHRLWTSVLVGMLAFPLLSRVLPELPLPIRFAPGWFIVGDPSASGEPAPLSSETSQPSTPQSNRDASQVPHRDSSERLRTSPSRQSNFINGTTDVRSRQRHGSVPNELGGARTRRLGETAETADDSSLAGSSSTLASVRRVVREALSLAWWGWLLGTAFLLTRIAFGFLAGKKLVRSSTPITTADLDDLGVPAGCWPSRRRAARLLECPRLSVPITLGTFRPVVLLPAEWLEWPTGKLAGVLLHERTHVERGDSAIAFLAELNVALHWLNPLSWWLRRHLAQLAEEACDDTAILGSGDRTGYARDLLDIAATAASVRGRIIPMSISMARSCVEKRISLILDSKRPLSTRPGWKATLLCLVGVSSLIALAAAIRPAMAEPKAPTTEAVENATGQAAPSKLSPMGTIDDVGEQSTNEIVVAQGAEPSLPRADDLLRFAGKVEDENGRPVEGARVTLSYWRGMSESAKPEKLAMSDADGKFELTCRRSEFADSPEEMPWAIAACVAWKSGHGFAAAGSVLFETTGRAEAEFNPEQRAWLERERKARGTTLKLRADLPIRGRIVDGEGRGVAGCLIEPFNADEGEGGSLAGWEAETKLPGANFYSVRNKLTRLFGGDFVNGPIDRTLPSVRTDAEGRFTLSSIGRERLFSAVLSGPGIESTVLHIRSRAGETIRLPEDVDDRRVRIFYPADFTHVAAASQPVEGVVTDLKTGKPVAGVFLRGERTATNDVGGNSGFISAKTDPQGRYRLEGFPLGKNQFVVLPSARSGYLSAGVEVETRGGAAAMVRDVALSPAVRVRGVVREEASGKPIRGYAEYFALRENPALRETKNFEHVDQQYLFCTDEEGKFEIPALPGPGLITFMANRHQSFSRGQGADAIKRPPAGPGGFDIIDAQPYSVSPTNYHTLVRIDPSAGSGPIDLDLKLTAMPSFEGRVLSEDGQSVESYVLFGENAPGTWYEFSRTTFQVDGYVPRLGRRLMAYDRRNDLAGHLDVTGPTPEKVEIRVRPAARIVGRFVDKDGAPMPGVRIDNDSPAAPKTPAEDRDHWNGKFDPERATFVSVPGHPILTGPDGRFELVGVIPGFKYSASVHGMMMVNGKNSPAVLGSLFRDVVVRRAGKHDLGDLRIRTDQTK
jgi:beta-lactamase regulating signal transducer with metallopeptidase domain